jgi:hypothetical protein
VLGFDVVSAAARLGDRGHALLTVDRHRGVEGSGPVAEVLQQLARVRALHESRLEQLRIIGPGVPFRLSLADDRQHLDFFYRLWTERGR